MLEYNLAKCDIRIELNNGIYYCCGEGGEGKTYLFKLLESVKKDNLVCNLTFTEGESNQYYINRLKRESYEFILLDRYDLYVCNEINQVLLELSRNAVIFVDLKTLSKMNGYGSPAHIDLDKRCLRLYDKTYF